MFVQNINGEPGICRKDLALFVGLYESDAIEETFGAGMCECASWIATIVLWKGNNMEVSEPLGFAIEKETQRETEKWLARFDMARATPRPYTEIRNLTRKFIAWVEADPPNRREVADHVVSFLGDEVNDHLHTILLERSYRR